MASQCIILLAHVPMNSAGSHSDDTFDSKGRGKSKSTTKKKDNSEKRSSRGGTRGRGKTIAASSRDVVADVEPPQKKFQVVFSVTSPNSA